MRRLLDALLTTDEVLRTRLVQAGMVTVAMCAGAAVLLALAAVGRAPVVPVLVWAALVPGAAAALFLAVRSGWSRRLEDPSLTMAQLVVGSIGCAFAYGLADRVRGGVFLLLMVLLMATMLAATAARMRAGSLLAVLALGGAMLHRAAGTPTEAWVELLHFLFVATMVPAATVLGTRMAAMRQRAQRQQRDLEAALGRIRELATRDELTGLVNRRHLRELMEQEHQRCIRTGRTFCIAVLDVDGFKGINEHHGRSVGDAVLRSIAHEAMRRVRVSDPFARWGGDRFVLLMCDSHAALARGGVERVRAGVGDAPLVVAGGELRISLSAGLAEHHAGETVEGTLERADRALTEAKQQGRDRLVLA